LDAEAVDLFGLRGKMRLIIDDFVMTVVDAVVVDVLDIPLSRRHPEKLDDLKDLARFTCLKSLSAQGYVDLTYRRWDESATFTVNKRKLTEARGKPFSKRQWTKLRKVSHIVTVGDEWSARLREMIRQRPR
jgi:hypothetical protein